MSRLRAIGDHGSIFACVLLLAAGLGLRVSQGLSDAELDAARLRIRGAFQAVPGTLGQWIKFSDDLVPPTQADMLGLNAHVSRTYQRLGESPGRRARIFIANSFDARSMAGHHPPNCYPSSGWLYDPADSWTRVIRTHDGVLLPIRIYRFASGTQNSMRLWVVSGFLLPDGQAVATLEETREISARASTSRLGMTQFQIVFDGGLEATDVGRYAEELLGALPVEMYQAVGGVVELPEGASAGGGS